MILLFYISYMKAVLCSRLNCMTESVFFMLVRWVEMIEVGVPVEPTEAWLGEYFIWYSFIEKLCGQNSSQNKNRLFEHIGEGEGLHFDEWDQGSLFK